MVQLRQPTLQEEYDYAKRASQAAWAKRPSMVWYGTHNSLWTSQLDDERRRLDATKNALWDKLQAEKKAAWAKDPNNPEVQAQKSWDDAQKILQRPGPLTPEIQQQIVNRRADQSAAAEAVNADEIRNMAAARGLDPTQAIRQGQQQRQASNIAFQGDTATNAAIQNFQATNSNMAMAAQAMLNRQFGGQRQSAVQGAPQMAFSAPRPAAQSSSFDPGAIHRAAAQQTFSKPQLAFSGNTPAPTPAHNPAPKPSPQPKPVQQTGAFNAPIYRTQAQQNSLLKSLNAPGNISASGGGGQPVTIQMPKRQDGSYWANPFK